MYFYLNAPTHTTDAPPILLWEPCKITPCWETTAKEEPLVDPFIRLQANDLVRVQFNDRGKQVPYARFYCDKTGELYHITVTKDGWTHVDEPSCSTGETLNERILSGRYLEQHTYYRFLKLGIQAELLPMVVDGDKAKKAPDLRVKRNNDRDEWVSLEVKPHCDPYEEPYTNDARTFPDSVIVDNVDAWNKKVETCEKKEAPLIAALKVHTVSKGVAVIPARSQNKWTTRVTGKYNKTEAYIAKKEHLKTIYHFLDYLGYNL